MLAIAEQKGKKVVFDEVKKEVESKYKGGTDETLAYELFKPINDGDVSKAIVAQHLATIIEADKAVYRDMIETDECLKYVVDAIKYVTQ